MQGETYELLERFFNRLSDSLRSFIFALIITCVFYIMIYVLKFFEIITREFEPPWLFVFALLFFVFYLYYKIKVIREKRNVIE